MRSHLKSRADWIEFLLGVYPATLLASLNLPLAVQALFSRGVTNRSTIS